MLDELKTLFKHTTIYGMGSVLGKMVGFFMIPFYTHYLTPADYGTLELLDLTLGLTALALTMWMNASIIRHYYDYDNDEDRKQVIGTVLILATVIGVVVGACGITWSRFLSQLVLKTPVFHVFITLISLSFFVSCLNAVSCSYLRAKQRSMFVVSGDLINLIVSLSLNIYFVAFRKVGVIGILYSSLLSNTLVTSILTAYTLWHVKLSFSFDKLKAIAAFGAPLVVTSLAAFTVNFSDRFFLQTFQLDFYCGHLCFRLQVRLHVELFGRAAVRHDLGSPNVRNSQTGRWGRGHGADFWVLHLGAGDRSACAIAWY